ncbi:RCH2, partial [Symbiodinium pilosum]
VMRPLLAAQGPLLLQLFQLWGLLVSLRQVQGTGTNDKEPADSNIPWVEEYIQWLQFTAQGFRDATSLECWLGARTANSLTALVGPCVPLALLALCMVPEVVSHGTGVSMALKLLTLLYIGGASNCAALMRCQNVDGGREPLGDFAFRAVLPDLKCQDPAPLADGIAWICAFCYGLLIPGFLAYLMFKQHMALAPSRRFLTPAKSVGGVIEVWVLPVEESESLQGQDANDEMKTRSLLAAAVAHICICFTGSVRVELRDERLILKSGQEKHEPERLDLDASSLVWKALQSKSDADLRRCQALARMLMERYVLEDVASSDRVVAGAKELFVKYAACQNVWFEIAMRIVAVALVAVIGSENGLEFVLGFTLCTAIAVGTFRPFRQHQVNDLQCVCFLCLAIAATGFSKGWLLTPRIALGVPCVVAFIQAFWPDGREALAVRLFKDAETRWSALQRGETVEFSLQSITLL